MRSFYALVQKNVLGRRRWRTRDEFADAIVYWIQHTFNRRGRQHKLGQLTSLDFELACAGKMDQAA